MKETSRRNLLKVAAAGSASAVLGLTVSREKSGGETVLASGQGHSHRPISGPLSNATVNFGAWQTNPPFDRFTVPNPPPPNTRNHHGVTPNEVTIQAGGTVNFIIGGFHLILIYDNGSKPEDIDVRDSALIPGTLPPGFIGDTNHLIYRGPDPRPLSQDRVETVVFPKAGTYLVICGVRPHFVNDDMYGYVRVLP